MLFKAVKYAVVGSFQHANTLAPLLGGVIIYLVMRAVGLPMAVPTDIGGALLLVLATFGAAWVVVVTVRFLYWPWKAVVERGSTHPVGAKVGDAAQWHIYPDLRTPKILSGPKSWPWYYMHTILGTFDTATGAREERVISTVLFISFAVPVNGMTLRVTSPDMSVPVHEVKFFCSNFAVIGFEGRIPTGTLVVTLI